MFVAIACAWAAQDEGVKALGGFSSFDFWILGGGGVGVLFVLPLEIACVATMGVVVASLLTLRREWIVPSRLLEELQALLRQERYEEADDLCEAAGIYLTRVVGAALRSRDRGFDAMSRAARSAADEQDLGLQRQVGWLSLLGSFAPLMGLFGTVVGMAMMFGQISTSSG